MVAVAIPIPVTVVAAIMVVVIAPPAAVPVVVAVPAMVVIEPAAIPFPISCIKLPPVVTRPDPAGARIGGQRPVSRVPPIASVDNVPVAVDPDIIRTRAPRLNPYHARWRWRTDLNPNRDLAENTSCGQQSKRNEFCFHGLRLPVQYSLQMLTPLDRSEYPSTLHVFSAGWWPFSTRYGAPEDRTLPGVTGLRNGSACRSALGRP